MSPVLCFAAAPDWLHDPGIARVFSVLRAAGGDARFVGGCVRDALAGRTGADIDVATTLVPQQAMDALVRAGIDVVPTGIDHGTITALIDGLDGGAGRRPLEITSLREDIETDGRRAVVRFTTDWRRDAERRDFTMNALMANARGEVYDAFDGATDLIEGRVRFIGDAGQRIDEDALRILRFFRFHAWYGRGSLDAIGLEACRDRAAAVASLSGERVRAELLKLLAAPDPVPAWRMMAGVGVLSRLVGAETESDVLDSVVRWGLGGNDAVFRLGIALSEALIFDPDLIVARLRLSRRERGRIVSISGAIRRWRQERRVVDEAGLRRIAVDQGSDAALATLAASLTADRPSQLSPDLVSAALSAPRFPLAGRDVVALGCAPGPEIGRVLAHMKLWWLDRDCRPDRDECLAELAAYVARSRQSG